MEITEEEEGEQRVTKRQSTIEETELPGEIDETPARPRSPITGPPVTLDSSIATSPKESQFADTTNVPSFAGAPRPASPTKSSDAELGRRMSSQSSRQDYYSSSSYLASKARVKLGPRPSADPAGRPRSSGDTKRPVASMPAGLKLLLKGGKKAKTQDDSSSIISEAPSEDTFLAPSLAVPQNNNNNNFTRPHTSGGRPSSSSGISVKSLPATSAPTKQAMTPEKLRLMKALQLREKKKREKATPMPPIPSIEMTSSPIPEVEEDPKTASAEILPMQVTVPLGCEPAQEALELVAENTEPNHVMQRPADQKHDLAADQQSVSKADSAIDIVSTAPTDHTSEHTHTDSRPPSPVCASEVGDSTKASSISESTDETLQPAGEQEGSDGKQEHEHAKTHSTAEEQVAGVATPSAEAVTEWVEDIPRAERQDAPKAPLTQPVFDPEVNITEAVEKQDVGPALNDVLAESSLIPTSKFASKLPSGQAAMDPMESRGQDPLNVTNVTSEPGRIDEADLASVDPPERTEDGSAASPSKWNLPVSKYSSTHDSSKLLAPSLIPAIVTSSVESSSNGQDAIADAADKMVDDGTTDEKRRSGRLDPILTSSDLPEKEAPQENGDITDELQSATNDDARSSMAMSPISETPPQPSEPPTPRMGVLRTVSTPVHSPLSTAGDAPPSATPSRSISSGSAFHQRMNQQQPSSSSHLAPTRQPGKLGGSLASRIKAFEQLASKNPPAAAPIISSVKDRPSSAFFSVQRNNSIRDGARSPSVLERTNSIYRGRTPTPADSEDSPESLVGRTSRERSGSVASRLSVFEGGNAPRGRPETVQVTARIVREPGQSYPRAPESSVDPSEYNSMELKQSPLIVDHRKDVETPEPATAAEAAPIPTPLVHAAVEPRRSLHERRLSRDKRNSVDASKDGLSRPGQRTSLNMARDFFRDSMVGKDNSNRPPSVHLQSSSLLSRLSINTRRKSISQDSSLLSPVSMTDKNESGDEKKEGNRASRLIRRLSSTFSPSRKQSTSTMTSPVLPEESTFDPEKTPQARATTAPTTAQVPNMVAVIGDVNVQFPENLLWKRRTMSLDSNGFLHLSPAQGAISSRERQLKQFHMSEFQTPYAPEIEFQELPNSVCLDFKTGSGLQIALQDRVGQQNVLLGEFFVEEDRLHEKLLTNLKQYFSTRTRSIPLLASKIRIAHLPNKMTSTTHFSRYIFLCCPNPTTQQDIMTPYITFNPLHGPAPTKIIDFRMPARAQSLLTVFDVLLASEHP